jgi:hypothetical protein
VNSRSFLIPILFLRSPRVNSGTKRATGRSRTSGTGGTGLEPVTPSLSRRPGTRALSRWLLRFYFFARATRRHREPPSDADIERGLRERAVSDPRAAEILLRWLQRPRSVTETPGVELDSMSQVQLESLYAGLVKIAMLPDRELQALVESLVADENEA